jgi:S1-C subfamily serine protease
MVGKLVMGMLVPAYLAGLAGSLEAQEAFQKAIRVASPSVVSIVSVGRGLFTQERQVLVASGVVLAEDGYVVTCGSRLGASPRLSVMLGDGSMTPARVVSTDGKADLAMLRVKRDGLHPIAVAGDRLPGVGQWLVIIGNPFGLARTRTDPLSASVGVVSAVRPVHEQGFDYTDPVILTDVTLNPGSSGGAMVDLEGRLVGISSPVLTSKSTNTELSFAVPASVAMKLLREARLAEGRKPEPVPTPPKTPEGGYLGAYILDENTGTKGGYIQKVVPDSPADKAGLAEGDLVTAINGTRVSNGHELVQHLDRLGVGARVELTVLRNKAELKVGTTLTAVPRPVLK